MVSWVNSYNNEETIQMNPLIIEFGSTIRNDNDSYSDKDLLIISEKKNLDLIKHYRASGYDVSNYTFSRMEKMVLSGSLFCKHLILESRIIKGSQFDFLNLFRNYIPKPKYEMEKTLLRKFYNFINNLKQQRKMNCACLNDINYVNLRNLLIKRNAASGLYNFSYESLINNLSKELALTQTERRALLNLRAYKTMYRRGFEEYDFFILRLSTEIISQLIDLNFSLGIDFKEELRNFSNYHILRIIELFFPEFSQSIQHIVRNPKEYLYQLNFQRTPILIQIIQKIENEPHHDLILKSTVA